MWNKRKIYAVFWFCYVRETEKKSCHPNTWNTSLEGRALICCFRFRIRPTVLCLVLLNSTSIWLICGELVCLTYALLCAQCTTRTSEHTTLNSWHYKESHKFGSWTEEDGTKLFRHYFGLKILRTQSKVYQNFVFSLSLLLYVFWVSILSKHPQSS